MLPVYVGSSKPDLISQRNTQMTNITARLMKDLTLQDINTTLIELQQSRVAAVDSCSALLRAHQYGIVRWRKCRKNTRALC